MRYFYVYIRSFCFVEKKEGGRGHHMIHPFPPHIVMYDLKMMGLTREFEMSTGLYFMLMSRFQNFSLIFFCSLQITTNISCIISTSNIHNINIYKLLKWSTSDKPFFFHFIKFLKHLLQFVFL